LGLLTLNWAPTSSSTKSISEPARKGRETSSTRAAAPVALDADVLRFRLLDQVEQVLEA
jgi:hypothetical protein